MVFILGLEISSTIFTRISTTRGVKLMFFPSAKLKRFIDVIRLLRLP